VSGCSLCPDITIDRVAYRRDLNPECASAKERSGWTVALVGKRTGRRGCHPRECDEGTPRLEDQGHAG